MSYWEQFLAFLGFTIPGADGTINNIPFCKSGGSGPPGAQGPPGPPGSPGSPGTPTDKSVVVTFDCANGANASQSTAVSADSTSGQAILNVTASTAFQPGMTVEIAYGTARSESLRVLSTGAGTITFETNLAFTHTAVQADTVKPQLRHYGLPFIRYGTTSGVYNMETDLPLQDDWGLFFTGLKTTYNGVAHSWQKTGHSVTVTNLYAATTYFAKAYAYDPLGFLISGPEFSFATSGDFDAFSDPGVTNVRLGTTYNYNSSTPNRTGTLDLPSSSNVKVGIVYDNTTTTGTYNGSDRWTDPGQATVLTGVTYKANSTTPNRTGTLNSVTQIADAVWSTDLSGYNVANTAGLMAKTMLKLIRNLLALVLG